MNNLLHHSKFGGKRRTSALFSKNKSELLQCPRSRADHPQGALGEERVGALKLVAANVGQDHPPVDELGCRVHQAVKLLCQNRVSGRILELAKGAAAGAAGRVVFMAAATDTAGAVPVSHGSLLELAAPSHDDDDLASAEQLIKWARTHMCPRVGLLTVWADTAAFRNAVAQMHYVAVRDADKVHVRVSFLCTRPLTQKQVVGGIKAELARVTSGGLLFIFAPKAERRAETVRSLVKMIGKTTPGVRRYAARINGAEVHVFERVFDGSLIQRLAETCQK